MSSATIPCPPLQFALYAVGLGSRTPVLVCERERDATEAAREVDPPENAEWRVDVYEDD